MAPAHKLGNKSRTSRQTGQGRKMNEQITDSFRKPAPLTTTAPPPLPKEVHTARDGTVMMSPAEFAAKVAAATFRR